jgi:hypothetical protein
MKITLIKIRDFIGSKSFKKILIGIFVAAGLLLIFQAGMLVGYHKAAFSCRFGDNYNRIFGGRHGSMSQIFTRGNFLASHGAAGKVVSINLPTLVVIGSDNIEKVVLIKSDTIIRRFDTAVHSADIKVDDFIVALGAPNESSQVEAKFVRILPFNQNNTILD